MRTSFRTLLMGAAMAVLSSGNLLAQTESFSVTIEAPANGRVVLSPALSASGRYAAGAVVTVRATPDSGFALDSIYYSVPGRFGQMYHESMTPEARITIDQNKRIGASFIAESAVNHLNVTHDVVYARPGVKPLKYDAFAPKGARGLPCIVIIHGGGWNANDEDIMRGLARELTKDGRFVVFSIDYRWAGRADGDAVGNTMANLIEDAFGAIAHVMEHAAQYGGDASRIGITGDSAGGHLAAVTSLMVEQIGSRGFGKTPGVFEFMPSYLPRNKSVGQVRSEMMAAIKAAAPSYGVFAANQLNHYSDDPAANDNWKDAIAPLSHIPPASQRAVPQYLIRGTRDPLISDAAVTDFMEALVKAGQRVEYVQVGGANHAFFDWKPNDATKATFTQFGVHYASEMKNFFSSVLR